MVAPGRSPKNLAGTLRRGVGLVALACAILYLLTPNGAAGHAGAPWSFGLNLRYALPALALGLALLPTWPAHVWPRVRIAGRLDAGAVVLVGLLTTVFLCVGLSSALWHNRTQALSYAAALALAGIAVIWLLRHHRRAGIPLLAAAATASVIVGGWLIQRSYLRDRYAPTSFGTPPALAFARNLHHARIAVLGFVGNYQLYGRDLSNRITYVGKHGPHGSFTEIAGCSAWRTALEKGRYDYVVIAAVVSPDLPWGGSYSAPRELRWTMTDPAAVSIAGMGALPEAFAIHGHLHPGQCGRLAASSKSPPAKRRL
jgi:hypothetical protein